MSKTISENLPDEMLAMAAILGDLRSFDALVLRYRAAAYRVAQSIVGNELAEDAVQESLLLAFKALPSIEEPSRFASWLYAITRHVALRMSRRSRQERNQRVDLDEAVLEHSEAFSRPHIARDAFEEAWVRAAIDELDENHRLILKLRFYDEMPMKRIADFLDLPLTTVKWRLHRAKLLLREKLEPEKEGWPRQAKSTTKT
ncbi:MAG TPA: RNA polymerase sigma factor [Blastocatellia bacterium]|nr:RNA polymerase sigma factor [Blastocatellia bacterium]